jgi:signal transduction histidine kinase
VLPRLFSRGARGKHAGVPAGHGLGLYIVHRVVELHQGRVEVIRNESDGVTFRLWMDQSPG